MPAPRRPGQDRPTSLVEHLATQAVARTADNSMRFDLYYRTARLLLQQANSYAKAKNEEQEFVMLMRFASLFVETMRQHKEYNKYRTDDQYKSYQQKLKDDVFPKLERLKISLAAKEIVDPHMHTLRPMQGAMQLSASRDLLPRFLAATPSAPPLPPPTSSTPAQGSQGGAFGASVSQVQGYPGQQLQQQQAMTFNVDDLLDIVEHGPGWSAGTQPPPPSAPSHVYSQQPSAPPIPEYQPKYQPSGSNRHALFLASNGSDATPGSRSHGFTPSASMQRSGSITLYPEYPTAPPARTPSNAGSTQALPSYPLEALQQLSIQQRLQPTAGPTPGPQPMEVVTIDPNNLPPGTPDVCCRPVSSNGAVTGYPAQPPLPSAPPGSYAALPSPPSQQPPQQAVQQGPSGPAEIQKRANMRDVYISVALMEDFMKFAQYNTRKGIESCGILAGRLSANDSVFTICTLIIPKQQGTTDTVQALNEEEVFEVQFSQELYPLGWIHTHPTQTCFLSSVDVHTHCGYQTMLDEAVAIVMAPTDRSRKCGIFRLTTPGGLQLVQKCEKRGFHAHPETHTGQPLYDLCGHVHLHPSVKHEVIDLR